MGSEAANWRFHVLDMRLHRRCGREQRVVLGGRNLGSHKQRAIELSEGLVEVGIFQMGFPLVITEAHVSADQGFARGKGSPERV